MKTNYDYMRPRGSEKERKDVVYETWAIPPLASSSLHNDF